MDIRCIKEIRQSYRDSKDFTKWSEDVPQEQRNRCFVVFYGTGFNLKSLSCLTLYAEDCANWCKGLLFLLEDVKQASNRLHQERWLRKSFYEMENPRTSEGGLGLTDLKKFMAKINCKIATSALKEKFSRYDKRGSGEIAFDDFNIMIQACPVMTS